MLALVGLISAALVKGPVQRVPAQTVAGSWSYTGSLNTPRSGYTATLLPNGKVLVAGGRSADRRLASAELYDPSTGTWSFTGSLGMSREAHAATLLGNGKVLVAGGFANSCCGQSDLTNTAELYDPATGEWSFTGNLNVLRLDHTATLLSNGKVLFAGGGIGGAFSATNTAELYDPATGMWSLTGKLSETRVGHQATLLQDGKVLVAGGCGDEECFDYLGSTEVFDPNTETWSITGGHNTPRNGHTLTLLQNGNVLMSGGQSRPFPFTLDTAELYNPATGRWSYTGSLLKRRSAATVTLLRNGQVLVAGGSFSYDSARPGHTEIFDSAELYDPAMGTWSTTASLNTARFGHTATLLADGKVLVVGSGPSELYEPETPAASWSYTGSLNLVRHYDNATLLPDGKVLVVGAQEVELYDPSAGTWSVNGTLKVPRQSYTATLLGNGKVLVAGGHEIIGDESAPELTNTAELYDPATGESRFTGNSNVLRAGHAAKLLHNGKVLFAGGVTKGRVGDRIEEFTTNTAELYDPATGQWSLTGNLSTARTSHAAALLQNGMVLVAGGYLAGGPGDDYLASAEVYDPSTETWSSTGSLNTPRGYHTLTTLANGTVLVSGGEGNAFPFKLNTAEIYNPATWLWSTTGTFNTARGHHTATLLSTGQVLVVGGITNSAVSNSAELYEPATGTWSVTASLNTPRYNHTATLLKNGKVLVVGGVLDRSAELYGTPGPDPTVPRIIMASITGKKLFLTGENFHAGAVILLNGEEQKTKNDPQNPQTILIGKKAGKKINAGDSIQVRNPDGSISAEFTFTGS